MNLHDFLLILTLKQSFGSGSDNIYSPKNKQKILKSTNKLNKHHCTLFIQGWLLNDRGEIQRYSWKKNEVICRLYMRILLKWSEKVSWSAGKQNRFMNHTYTNSSQGNFSVWLLEFGLSNQQTHILLLSDIDAGKFVYFSKQTHY